MNNIIQRARKGLAPIMVSVICAYALYLRLLSLCRHALWNDEMWQIDQMTGSFADMLRSLPTHEVSPYLSGDYYLIYPFFKIFGYNKWGLAVPHIIATILGFYFLYLICKRYFRTAWGYALTFGIVCFNSWLIYHATEIRVYAVLPTLALMSLYLTQSLVDDYPRFSAVKRLAFALFFVALILFHTYGVMIFFCTLTFAVLARKEKAHTMTVARRLTGFLTIVLCLSMPLWICSSRSGPLFLRTCGYPMTVTDYIPSPLTDPIQFLKSVFGNLIGLKYFYIFLPGSIFPFMLPVRDRAKQAIFFAVLVIAPIAFIYILDIIVVYHFIPRQFVWVMPLFAFYLGWTWDSVLELVKNRSRPVRGV